jgi:hypothetical protein
MPSARFILPSLLKNPYIMRLLHVLPIGILLPFSLSANYLSQELRQTFIEAYSGVAIEEMHTTGIPASITLAQAILESNWGQGTLAQSARNFFGIKCYNGWIGGVWYHWDDDKYESCFRSYENELHSFRDHSDFLRENPRYAPLFRYGSDYREWALGLQAKGYATDTLYAEKLINLIEEYQLSRYDEELPAGLFVATNQVHYFEPQPSEELMEDEWGILPEESYQITEAKNDLIFEEFEQPVMAAPAFQFNGGWRYREATLIREETEPTLPANQLHRKEIRPIQEVHQATGSLTN